MTSCTCTSLLFVSCGEEEEVTKELSFISVFIFLQKQRSILNNYKGTVYQETIINRYLSASFNDSDKVPYISLTKEYFMLTRSTTTNGQF